MPYQIIVSGCIRITIFGAPSSQSNVIKHWKTVLSGPLPSQSADSNNSCGLDCSRDKYIVVTKKGSRQFELICGGLMACDTRCWYISRIVLCALDRIHRNLGLLVLLAHFFGLNVIKISNRFLKFTIEIGLALLLIDLLPFTNYNLEYVDFIRRYIQLICTHYFCGVEQVLRQSPLVECFLLLFSVVLLLSRQCDLLFRCLNGMIILFIVLYR